MKQSKAFAKFWPGAIGTFLGAFIYHLVVHRDLTRGIIVGLIAACLLFLVRAFSARFRRSQEQTKLPSH